MIALNQHRFADPAFKGSKEIEPKIVPAPPHRPEGARACLQSL
jgi:hypothetical protein